MQKITIKKATFDMVKQHAIGNQINTDDAVFNDLTKTITLPVEDEIYDYLKAEIDDITPNFDDVLVRLCRAATGFYG